MVAAVTAGTLALALPSAAFQTGSNRLEGNKLGRFTITQAATPPDVLARTDSLKQASLLTEPLFQKSDIKQVKAYRDFLRKAARQGSKIDQLKAVNDYVSNNVWRVADSNLYQGSDVWAPPINTLVLGGDCEDMAVLKAFGLRYMGFRTEDLFLVVGVSSNVNPPEGHAILVVRVPSGEFFVLDNTDPRVLPVNEVTSFQPAYAVNWQGYWTIDDPTHDYGDTWRQAFKTAAVRHSQ